jgi:hypothetical protein
VSKLNTLGADVQRVLRDLPLPKAEGEAAAIDAGFMAGARIKRALTREQKGNTPPFTIFPSEVGHPCKRKLWYDRHYSAVDMKPVEEIGPNTKMKFMYGDMLESIAIPLIRATGRSVSEVDAKRVRTFTDSDGDTWTVSGRTDLCVDGCVVDVKSMSGISYQMYTTKGIPGADTFGYRWQLHTYNWMVGSTDESGLFGINKENGAVSFIENEETDLEATHDRLLDIAVAVKDPLIMPSGIPDQMEGASGNRKLSTICSYCKYKDECWKMVNGGSGPRKFLYSNKVVYLTEVKREPKVTEVT